MSVLEIFENLTYEVAVTIGDTDVSPYFERFEFSESLGGAAQATLRLVDKDSNNLAVRPSRFGPDGGSLPLHPHNMTAGTPVSVIVTASEVPSEYPTWLIDDVDFPTDGGVTVGLVDYHTLLEQDGYNGSDIQAESGTITSAHTAIKAMCAELSIPASIGWTNYDINEKRRSQTSRLKVIRDLGKHAQAFTQFRGGKLYFDAPRYSGSDFDLTDVVNLTNLSYRETTAGHKNRFRASRLQPGMNRIVGEARGDTYGRNSQTTVNISPPSRLVQGQVVKLEKGTLGTWVGFDAADVAVATSDIPLLISAYPIARVEFTFFPASYATDLSIIDAEFHVYFTGSKGQPVFDSEFNSTYNLSAEQTYYGVREEYTVVDDAAWPTKALATLAATNMAIENADQRIISSWASWLNPRIRAGSRVSITDWQLRQAGTSWLVRSAQHSISHTSATMTIGCSRRRT